MSRGERIDRRDMEAVIEAILFVATDPVPEHKLFEVFGEGAEDDGLAALEAVVERYEEAGGGIVVDRAAGGLRLVSRPDLHGYLRRFFEVTGSNKLSMPALETLAIVAYRQPVTAPEIAELRGVNSQGVLKKLLERRLVRVAGRKEVVGKPFLYATTRDFLMHFGLRHLDELPPLEQFEEMWAGDSEADADADLDLEEVAGREEAEAAERDEAAPDASEEAEDLRQQLEAEAAEAPVHAEPADGGEAVAGGEVAAEADIEEGGDDEEELDEEKKADDDVDQDAAPSEEEEDEHGG